MMVNRSNMNNSLNASFLSAVMHLKDDKMSNSLNCN